MGQGIYSDLVPGVAYYEVEGRTKKMRLNEQWNLIKEMPYDRSEDHVLNKLITNANRYGWLHACTAYLGRKSSLLWRVLGPRVTKRYRERWMRESSRRAVNLGCGSHLIQGMLNADIGPRADVYIDISRRLPFADETLDGIFCEEVIEHLPYDIAHRFLEGCYRCLKGGATIRLSPPDLDFPAAF